MVPDQQLVVDDEVWIGVLLTTSVRRGKLTEVSGGGVR